MKRPAISTGRAAISRAQEITLLKQRLAFILELEQILKQDNAKLQEAAKLSSARIQNGTVNYLAGCSSTPTPSTRASTELHA